MNREDFLRNYYIEGNNYVWFKKNTRVISSLPDFVLYTGITSCSFAIGAFCFGLISAVPAVVPGILFMVFAVTMSIAAVGFLVMVGTCNYRGISKEYYKILKEERRDDKMYARRKVITKFLDGVERIGDFLHIRRNDETPERDNSFDERSETRNCSFLRRLITERFNSKKPSAVSPLLGRFNQDEDTITLVERVHRKNNSSVRGYGSTTTTGMLYSTTTTGML